MVNRFFYLTEWIEKDLSLVIVISPCMRSYIYLQERKVPAAEMAWPSSEILEIDVEIVSYNTRLMAKIFSLLKN